MQGASRTFRQLHAVRESAPAYGFAEEASTSGSASDETDPLTSLGEEIMTLAERLSSMTYRWLALIAEFDRRRGWKLYGFSSCADWLAYSTFLDKATARERVRVARRLSGLPEISAAMARGELSFSQARAITRVADEENELDLLAEARSMSASGLERLVRSWRRIGRKDEAELDRRRHASRALSVFPDDDGMYLVRGRLDAEAAALLLRAIEAASDALYRGSVPDTTPEQRRADAIVLLAERAFAAGFGGPTRADAEASAPDSGARSAGSHAPAPSAGTGTPARSAGSDAPSPSAGTASERYMVVLHVDAQTLAAGDGVGRADLEDGTRVSAETSRRLACDASVVRVSRSRSGAEVQVTARTRSVPLRLRRALEVRDRGCRFPGCGSRYADAHHVEHWADGGATRLENLILLCKTHHRLLHEGGFTLRRIPELPGRLVFFSPRGVPIPEVPPRVTWRGEPPPSRARSEPDSASDERLPSDRAGSHGLPRWEKDVPLSLYLRAMESIG